MLSQFYLFLRRAHAPFFFRGVKCNAHLNNTFYSYFRVHGKTQPRVFFNGRKGGVDEEGGVLSDQGGGGLEGKRN